MVLFAKCNCKINRDNSVVMNNNMIDYTGKTNRTGHPDWRLGQLRPRDFLRHKV